MDEKVYGFCENKCKKEVPSLEHFNATLGGLSLVALTQEEYDALPTKDNSTVYFIKES